MISVTQSPALKPEKERNSSISETTASKVAQLNLGRQRDQRKNEGILSVQEWRDGAKGGTSRWREEAKVTEEALPVQPLRQQVQLQGRARQAHGTPFGLPLRVLRQKLQHFGNLALAHEAATPR